MSQNSSHSQNCHKGKDKTETSDGKDSQSVVEVVCVQTEAERHLTEESGWDDLRDKTSKRVEGTEETRKRVLLV